MHVEPSLNDLEDEAFFPPLHAGDVPFSAGAFQSFLERIRVPTDRNAINQPGWKEDEQLINYETTWVDIKFAHLCIESDHEFDGLDSYPSDSSDGRQEAYLLDPRGKPLRYIGPSESGPTPIEAIFELKRPRLVQYVLWLTLNVPNGQRRHAACLFVLDGNEPFKKMLEVYEQYKPFCAQLHDLIERRGGFTKE